MMATQQYSRDVGDEICIFHPGRKLVFECKDCPGELACIACATSIHQQHKLVDIKHKIQGKIVKIKSFIKNTKDEILPAIVKEIKLAITSLKAKEKEFKEEIRKVETHGEIMVEQVVISTAEKVSMLEFLLKEISDMLRNHQVELEKLQFKLQNDTKEYENALKSGSTYVSIHDMELQIDKTTATFTIPELPQMTTPTFSPCKDTKPCIEKGFGEFTDGEKPGHRTKPTTGKGFGEVGEGRGKKSGDRIKPTTGKGFGEVSEGRRKKSGDRISRVQYVTPEYKFLDPPKTLYNINISYRVRYNCMLATLDNMVWLYGGDDYQLHLIDETGKEKQTLKPDVELLRICTNPVTGKLYCTTMFSDTIRQVDTHAANKHEVQTSVMFSTTGSRPCGIGCTTDDHLVITHPDDRKLCIYNFTGDVISTYNYTGQRYAEVAVCNKTNNIALIQQYDGFTVLNNKLQVLFTNIHYVGQGTEHREKIYRYASTAAFADEYLLVGGNYRSVYVRGRQDGNFLKIIDTKEMSKVTALCVLQDPPVVYVAFYDPNKILCIKYMK